MENPPKKSSRIKKAILEFFPVFLGVVLALFFENLNEARIDRQKISGLLNKIELGTQKNIENLDLQLDRNQMVIDSLKAYQYDTDKRIGDVLSLTKGIRHIQFDLAAWNVLKSSELLVDVEYNLVSYLYLLSESVAQPVDLQVQYNSSESVQKEVLISDLEDYAVAINYQKYLSEQILGILKGRN